MYFSTCSKWLSLIVEMLVDAGRFFIVLWNMKIKIIKLRFENDLQSNTVTNYKHGNIINSKWVTLDRSNGVHIFWYTFIQFPSNVMFHYMKKMTCKLSHIARLNQVISQLLRYYLLLLRANISSSYNKNKIHLSRTCTCLWIYRLSYNFRNIR